MDRRQQIIMRSLSVVAPLVVVLACVVPASASVSHLRVSGIQSPPDITAGHPGDPCRSVDPQTGLPPAISNTMTGSLIGCWYTDTFEQVMSNPNGEILAIGTEHFVGCLNADRKGSCGRRDPRGTLAFIYAFEAKFDKSGKELRGGCQHPILSGTGAFRGARGRLNFTDNVANGTSAYRGQITLGKRARNARATVSSVRRSPMAIC
jgi:hypothetical protein